MDTNIKIEKVKKQIEDDLKQNRTENKKILQDAKYKFLHRIFRQHKK